MSMVSRYATEIRMQIDFACFVSRTARAACSDAAAARTKIHEYSINFISLINTSTIAYSFVLFIRLGKRRDTVDGEYRCLWTKWIETTIEYWVLLIPRGEGRIKLFSF